METKITDNQRRVEVCYTPALFPVYYSQKDCIVVVIDIFRATSTICTAFQHGIKEIIPVSSVDEAREYQDKGYIVAAERQGEIVKGFDMGNSPFSFMDPKLKGKSIVLTTTNGTKAIKRASAADYVVIGSFLNVDAICKYLIEMEKHVVLLCAGWRDRFNMEDSLFAGAVVNRLKQHPTFQGIADSSMAANHLYELAKDDMLSFLQNTSHQNRLVQLNLKKDISYCLQENITDVIPKYEGNTLIL